jgi:hypothetical protein
MVFPVQTLRFVTTYGSVCVSDVWRCVHESPHACLYVSRMFVEAFRIFPRNPKGNFPMKFIGERIFS